MIFICRVKWNDVDRQADAIYREKRKKKRKKERKKNTEKYFYKNRIFDDVKTQK